MRDQQTILCVDGYEAILGTLTLVLPQFGYRVLTANCLSDALAAAREHQPDAVLLDYHLCPECPATASPCIAEQIKIHSPSTRIVVWCADGSSVRNPPRCARTTLTKPVEPEDLARRLKEALRE
jgi:CheY-like chemotaxis protein